MSVKKKIRAVGSTIWITVWGLRNHDDIMGFYRSYQICSDCGGIDDFEKDKICEEHLQEYESLFESGPFSNNPFN